MPGVTGTAVESSMASALASLSFSPSSPSHPHAQIVTPDDEATIAMSIDAIASAFASEALVAAFAAEAGKSVHEYIDGAFRASLGSGHGTLVEAGSVSAVALWELPEDEDEESLDSGNDSDLGGTGDEKKEGGAEGGGHDRTTVTRTLRLLPNGQVHKAVSWEAGNKGAGRDMASSPSVRSQPSVVAHSSGTMGQFRREWKAIIRRAKEKHIGLADPKPGSSQTTSDLSSTERPLHHHHHHHHHHHNHHHHHPLPPLSPHYHLDFLARNPNSAKVPGAVSAVVKPLLARARREGRRVWLETSSAEVVSMYEYFGFRTVEEVTVGANMTVKDGRHVEEGKGITVWLMLV